MNKKLIAALLALCITATLVLSGCGGGGSYTVSFDGIGGSQTVKGGELLQAPEAPERSGYTFSGWYTGDDRGQRWDFGTDKVTSDMTLYPVWELAGGEEIQHPQNDKDFSGIKTPGSQESAYTYDTFFIPAVDGLNQGYVGDTMPYYEDGTYYIYYLKEGGDSFNHAIYVTTTTDFVTYTESDPPVLEGAGSGQDAWLGTGSVCKVDGTYYLFYTGHSFSDSMEYKEKIMVARSDNPYHFERVSGWEITPPADLHQKNDFRDPQVYYNPETGKIEMTVTAAQSGTAKIIKYTLSKDLSSVEYDGVIFTNTQGSFWNLECSDTFRIGDTWYITYSAQDDCLWYASSPNRYGPYSEAKRLDGQLFYAAKHADDGQNYYMVGWARRSESASSTQDVNAWGGNMIAQKIVQLPNGELQLAPIDGFVERHSVRRELLTENTHAYVASEGDYVYSDVFQCYESFRITGEFTFTGTGMFGLSFDFNGKADKNKLIAVNPAEDSLVLYFNEGETRICQKAVELREGETYSFTYIQEGSVGVFYIDDMAAMTVRIYGATGKPIQVFAKDCSVLFSSLRQYTK